MDYFSAPEEPEPAPDEEEDEPLLDDPAAGLALAPPLLDEDDDEDAPAAHFLVVPANAGKSLWEARGQQMKSERGIERCEPKVNNIEKEARNLAG